LTAIALATKRSKVSDAAWYTDSTKDAALVY